MTPRRALAVVISLLLTALPAAPAAAQARPVPVEAGTAPLAASAGFTRYSPLLPERTPSAPVPPLGPSLAAAWTAPQFIGEPPASAAARPALVCAVPALAAPADGPADLAPHGASAGDVFDAGRAGSAFSGDRFDALFDGRSPDAGLSPISEPEQLSGASGPALKPKARGRAWRIAAVSVPAIAAVAAFGAAAPHLALVALHWLGEGVYWLANPFAFTFTIPQIHRMISRRSADVSTAMAAVGLLATFVTALNFAFDGKDLMMYRNLAQAAGFGGMLALKACFARASLRIAPSRRRAALETAAIALAMVGLLALAGPALAAALPAVAAMGALLVPFQVLAGFGFTYLMYAQLSKMRRDQSPGDSSAGMMWAYFGTKTIWVWSFATMLALSTAPAWLTLSAGAVSAGVCWFVGRAALARLLRTPWSFLPQRLSLSLFGRTLRRETMAEIGTFLVLSALILALSAGGYFAFTALFGIPAAATPRFAMYLLYMVQSLVACLATLKTLRIRASFDQKD